jgi:hypothetical protein
VRNIVKIPCDAPQKAMRLPIKLVSPSRTTQHIHGVALASAFARLAKDPTVAHRTWLLSTLTQWRLSSEMLRQIVPDNSVAVNDAWATRSVQGRVKERYFPNGARLAHWGLRAVSKKRSRTVAV